MSELSFMAGVACGVIMMHFYKLIELDIIELQAAKSKRTNSCSLLEIPKDKKEVKR